MCKPLEQGPNISYYIADKELKATTDSCSCPCHLKTTTCTDQVPIPDQNEIKTETSALGPCQNETEPCSSSSVQCAPLTCTSITNSALGPCQNETEPCSSSSVQCAPLTCTSITNISSCMKIEAEGKVGEGDDGVGGGEGSGVGGDVGCGVGDEGSGVGGEVIVIDDDFRKPKKRYRTPGGGGVATPMKVTEYI